MRELTDLQKARRKIEEAKKILGQDFITPDEVMWACPDFFYTDKQIVALAKNLPSQKALKECKEDGYAVVPGPPNAMTLLGIRKIWPCLFYSKEGGWYADQEFARKDKTSSGWFPFKKTSVFNSVNRTWNEQEGLLSTSERVPNAAEMCWFILIYFLVLSIRLFKCFYVRTSSIDSDGDHVSVGLFGSEGLYVGKCWNSERHSNIALSAAKK